MNVDLQVLGLKRPNLLHPLTVCIAGQFAAHGNAKLLVIDVPLSLSIKNEH